MGCGEVLGHLSLHFPSNPRPMTAAPSTEGSGDRFRGTQDIYLSFLGCPLLDNNRTGGAWQGEGHGASLGEEEQEEEEEEEGEQGGTGTRTEEDKVTQRQSQGQGRPPEGKGSHRRASGSWRESEVGRAGGQPETPPEPCGDQATKAREDSALGTHPTEGRAQHPQSSRPWVVSCTNSPLSSLTATLASSLLSDPEEDSTEDDDSDGRSHPVPLSSSFPSVDLTQTTREAGEEDDSGTGCATGQPAHDPEAPEAPGVRRQREPGRPRGPTCGSDLGPEEDSAPKGRLLGSPPEDGTGTPRARREDPLSRPPHPEVAAQALPGLLLLPLSPPVPGNPAQHDTCRTKRRCQGPLTTLGSTRGAAALPLLDSPRVPPRNRPWRFHAQDHYPPPHQERKECHFLAGVGTPGSIRYLRKRNLPKSTGITGKSNGKPFPWLLA
ncbi:uncharacterized protein KIAA1522-like [Lutra lutra]|uniref:uncharacterized protein KIAA1522-like n=1 Tax=Lutra lutra TaxID=9657 RepID=UPI001FD37680|nr:uncharacterized protein KIAA1522-like [Lutra lutra]